MNELLAQILLSAAEAMWKHQPTLGKYTQETREREPDLTTHYGHEVRRWFPWLDINFDLIKPHFGDQRPDIVLHRRNSNAANFLVIEVKRHANRGEVPADLDKIRGQWFKGNLRYRYGASLILDEADHRRVEVCVLFRDESESKTVRELGELSRRVPVPEQAALEKFPLPMSVERIVSAKQENPAADTNALEQEIDQMVYALYGSAREGSKIVEGTVV